MGRTFLTLLLLMDGAKNCAAPEQPVMHRKIK
jgi:hypothetical protein